MLQVNPLEVTQVGPGVKQARSVDRQLVMYTIENGNPATIEAWGESARRLVLDWPESYPCLMLHDLHHSDVLAFNAQMQDKFQQLYSSRPNLTRYVAVLMPHEFVADITRLSIKTRELMAPHQYPVHWEVFTRRKDALAWLLSKAM